MRKNARVKGIRREKVQIKKDREKLRKNRRQREIKKE